MALLPIGNSDRIMLCIGREIHKEGYPETPDHPMFRNRVCDLQVHFDCLDEDFTEEIYDEFCCGMC